LKISIVIPTHRSSNSALARILECSNLDPDRFEVIVRDNSGNAAKHGILEATRTPAVVLSKVEDRGAFENSIESLKRATGDWVYFMADDDWISTRALSRVHDLALAVGGDRTISCIAGTYFLETSSNAGLLRYTGIDSQDAAARLTAYFDASAPNVLFYSAVRRDIARFCFDFLGRLPFKFSYHDQLVSMVYLAAGRVVQIDGVIYFYDLGEWETAEKTLAKDRSMYRAAGLPPEVDRLHHLLCAMEGGFLINSQFGASLIPADHARLLQIWFGNMFQRFRQAPRPEDYPSGAVNDSMRAVARKWQSQETVDLNELLVDVCDAIESADPDAAQRYFQFWSTL
jgi:glycosyltransferase involved in cell wall biosynthesis